MADKVEAIIQVAMELRKHEIILGPWPFTTFTCSCGTWEGASFQDHLRTVAREGLRNVSNASDPSA